MSEGSLQQAGGGLLVLRQEQQIDLHYSPNSHIIKQEQLQVMNFSSYTQQSLFSAQQFSRHCLSTQQPSK